MTTQIGIDLGGTKIEVAVLDDQGQFMFRHRQASPSHSYPAILNTIAELVTLARQTLALPAPSVVGIGMPGCLDAQTQRVRGSNTQAMNHQPLKADLQQVLGCEVRLENDANCLALSEAMDGAGARAQVVFAAILGTGCGGGVVVNRQLLSGRHAIAGEWGHNPLPWPSAEELNIAPCWCGQTGCIETWLSGTGFALDHARVNGEERSAVEIIQAMRKGDSSATATFERYVNRLGRALAQLVNLLDPDCIVLGGGMSNVQEIYPKIQAAMQPYVFGIQVNTPVLAAQHGDSSGVRGAAWLSR
ncbi:MAG: ROK family protein [Burkholderiaceae bacterium]|jgi:fructokinase|nr:ROK family protein [Burkholderiaceae bacterium]